MSSKEYKITSESKNITAVIFSYGAIIKDFFVKHPNGKTYNIVLGHKTLDDYKKDKDTRMGAFVGRHLGRINNAEFTIGGISYHLTKNNNNAHLHGNLSSEEFTVKEHTEHSITFTYFSKDTEDGFPGNMNIELTYRFDGEVFSIITKATTDKPTIFAPSNHTYFNLDESDTIYNSILKISTNKAFEIDKEVCQTGKILDVTASPLDFQSPSLISKSNNSNYDQTLWAGGIDHSYLFDKIGEAVLEGQNLKLRVSTSEKCIHVYSSGSLGECKVKDRNDKPFNKGGAICFETKRYNENEKYPVLRPEDEFISTTNWEISYK